MKQDLLKYLFREESHTYAVLDGASVPDLPGRFYELRPPHFCLYMGELDDELTHVAPYLVQLHPQTRFTDWLLGECWGKHWGIFAQTQHSLIAMRKHFRTLLTVYDDKGQPLLFRYYDPRVLSPFLLTCNIEELETMFGDVNYYFAESDDKSNLLRFHLKDTQLVQTQLKMGADGQG